MNASLFKKILILFASLLTLNAFAASENNFFIAAQMDNAAEVRRQMKIGVDPNARMQPREETALMMAARENAMNAMKALLENKKTDINLRAKNGDTAIMLAAFKKNKEAVELFLKHGAELNHDGWTALHYAAYVGDTDIVKLLIKHGAKLDATSPNLTTPLMMAAWGGHVNVVKILVDAGADLNRVNSKHHGIIDYAKDYVKRGGRESVVQDIEKIKAQSKKQTEARITERERLEETKRLKEEKRKAEEAAENKEDKSK